jgi:hypothetical protein
MITPDETPFHHALEVMFTIVMPMVLAGIVWILKTVMSTSVEVSVIKNNHLVHLDQKIEGVREDVKEVRGKLFDHILQSKIE